MKSLVTGGAGFIGSHIVDRLVKMGHEVIVIDNESAETHDQFYYNNQAKYFKLDISDYESTRALYNNVDYVFHCAAESRIQPSISNPLGTIKTNVLGTSVVLQASKEASVKKVINSSTSSSYGLKNTPPLREDMIEDCLTPYSVSKISAEKLCSLYTNLFGLKTVTLRYFNVYGPREPLRGHYAPVIGLFLKQFQSSLPLTIVSDGTQRRDFTYIDDVVEANILAMLVDDHTEYGTAFNVGTGRNYSILEIASMISDKIILIPPRKGEAYITLADNSKIKRVLGWEPKYYLEDYIKTRVSQILKE